MADAASAQGLFGALFGGQVQPAVRAAPPPARAPAYADPGHGTSSDPLHFFRSLPPGSAAAQPAAGGSFAYCVRLCDGRYFPLQRHGEAAPAEMCSAFCPAAKTKIFYGSAIEQAVGHDGKSYSNLANAFVYRERLVSGCTCNGRDGLGLAALDAASDPTLRPGDIVATKNGLKTFSGMRSRRGSQVANFTAIDRSGLPRDLWQRLARTSVRAN
jgi:hypothetical protein